MTKPEFISPVQWQQLDVLAGDLTTDQALWISGYFGEERLPVPVMIGVLPLQSSRHAEFLHNEVPGIVLTDRARDRMRKAGSEGRTEGIRMARELLSELVPYADGTYLMPSFGRYEVAAEVISVLEHVQPATSVS